MRSVWLHMACGATEQNAPRPGHSMPLPMARHGRISIPVRTRRAGRSAHIAISSLITKLRTNTIGSTARRLAVSRPRTAMRMLNWTNLNSTMFPALSHRSLRLIVTPSLALLRQLLARSPPLARTHLPRPSRLNTARLPNWGPPRRSEPMTTRPIRFPQR